MLYHSLLPISLLFCLFQHVQASETTLPPGLSIPILRNSQGRKSPTERAAWAARQASKLKSKYGLLATPSTPGRMRQRASGTNDLVNHNQDSSYFGTLAVGTPPSTFNVILDTGSSDMWLASSTCRRGCTGIHAFNPSSSSTFKDLQTPFQIQYGSGAAQGTLGEDNVQMAGFSVTQQTFAVVQSVTPNLLTNPVSGLLGLAFQSIASSHALPFWQSLVESNVWDEPVMSFYLTRFINSSDADTQEPGGRFTMGFIDKSLYAGEIEFVPIPSGEQSYWTLPMSSMTVNGQPINLEVTGQSTLSAIDTGTTLIGGPSAIIAQIFASIPGSAPATGDYEGYYTYPCSTTVEVSLSFGGGTAWPINPEDFLLSQLTTQTCLGAFFSLDMGSGPTWIVGDTFLKNVYSVFRSSPPSVGFAALSVTALDLAVAGGPLPSPTIDANPTIATARKSAASLSTKPATCLFIAIVLSVLF